MLGRETTNPTEKNWSRIWRDFWITVGFIAAVNLIGFASIWFHQSEDKLTPMFWALACLASGGVVGFLFGIPRVLQGNNASTIVASDNGEKGNSTKDLQPYYRMQVNTNLEQISDWLTKIIVGIGLIELRRLPEFLNSLSLFLAKGLDTSDQTQVRASVIIVYFVIVGFLGGYLMTRIYLAQAFSRADWGTQNTVNIGGSELTLEEISEQQRTLLTDLQAQFLKNQKLVTNEAVGKTIEAKALAPDKPQVRSILWVDDNPKNNSLLIEQFTKLGIDVVSSLSTTDALAKLESRSFDKIISDMGRSEEGNMFNNRAGLDLIQAVMKRNINTPIIIYCSTTAATKYRREALEAGAIEITSSATALISALDITF